MFALFNIQITYLFLTFTKAVLTYTPTNPPHKKRFNSDIPTWLLSIIILLGIIDLLLAIYLIMKFIKRRRRREDEGNRKVVGKEEEKIVEQLPAAPTTPSGPLSGFDPSSPIEEAPSTSVYHTCEMDLDSHIEYDDQSTSIDTIHESDQSPGVKVEDRSISIDTVSENDQSPVVKVEDRSISIDTVSENEPSQKSEGLSSSIGTLSDYNHDSDLKDTDYEASFSIGSYEEIIPGVEEAVNEASSLIEFNQEMISCEKEEQSGSSENPLSTNINFEMENGNAGEEEKLTIPIDRIDDGENDPDHKYEQEFVSLTSVEEKSEIVEEKISGISEGEEASEKRTEDMNTSEKLEEGMFVISATEEPHGEIYVPLNDEKDEFTTDSSLVEAKEPVNRQDAVLEVSINEDVIAQEEISPSVSGEISTTATSNTEPSKVSGNYTNEHAEGEGASSNSKENLKPLDYSQGFVKARNGVIRKNPRTRRFSRISSKVLSAAGKVQEVGSSQSDVYFN